MLDRLRCRTLVTDGGTEHANFPDEGLCVLKVMGSGGKEIPWPAWLVARGLGTWSGKSTRHFAHKQFERDDGLRSVCCYGSGWQLRVPEAELHDYDPAVHAVAYEELPALDRYILHQLDAFMSEAKASYDEYGFSRVYSLMQQFAVSDLSNFYLDVGKDRLYISAPAQSRRW